VTHRAKLERQNAKRRVVEVVSKNPGMTLAEIARLISRSTCNTLDLIRESDIQPIGARAVRRYYPADWTPPNVVFKPDWISECKVYRVDPNLLTQKAVISPDLERLREA